MDESETKPVCVPDSEKNKNGEVKDEKQETPSVAVKKEKQEESPVAVKKEKQEQSPVAVKKEKQEQSTVAVKKEKQEESAVAVKEEQKETSDEKPSILEQKIISQIEYYFGDHNLMKDKFLQGKTKEDDGWVPLSVLLTFNRLKSLTTEADAVVKALQKSSRDLVKFNDDQTKIRRNPEMPLPENQDNWRENDWNKTVYVKGFPVDSSMDMVMDFFKNEGEVANIFMRKNYHSKSFKGSVFVTFVTSEQAETFQKKDGQKYKNNVLIKEMRRDYQQRKHSEFIKRREEREKRKMERLEKGNEEEPVDFNPDEDMKKDCLLKLTGFAEGTSREDIKDVLSPHGPIAYVDFKIGETVAVVRFEESGKAKDVLEKSKTGEEGDKKLMIKNAEISASFPEGDEEVEYWKKIVTARSNFNKDRRNHKRRGGPSGGRGGKYGRGDYRGRGRGGRGRGGYDRHERKRPAERSESNGNGDEPEGNLKRAAQTENADEPPVKLEKPEKANEPPVNLEKSDS